MNHDSLANVGIGGTGTLIAYLNPANVGMAAGLATTAWMLWQLGCSIYDRYQRRRREKSN